MNQTKSLVYSSLFTALIAVGAFIRIPIPVIPFTLQTLFVLLAGSLLGAKRGIAASIGYMVLGLAGLPIFTEGGGIWYVFKPSFGYIIGFCVGAFVTGLLAERMKKKTVLCYLIANLIGLLLIYAIGMAYCYVISNYVIHTPIAVGPLFLYCFILVVPGDIVLCVLAAMLVKRVKPVWEHL